MAPQNEGAKMPTIVVKTQAEFDALPAEFSEFTVVEIRSPQSDWIKVNACPKSSRVEARESSRVVARGSSRVVAMESSSVEARGSSSVVAWGSSSVEARESSSVVAWGSSRVEAWGSSRVVAWGSVAVYVSSDASLVTLFAFAVALALVKTKKITKKSKTATIVRPKHNPKGVDGWLESQAIKSAATVVLFKRVSKEFKTQEGTPNETEWKPGSKGEHPKWEPKAEEIGAGKYHAVSRPYFADEFRSTDGDRYVALAIKKSDLYAWPSPQFPHKIAFRAFTVLHECDRFGMEVK